MAQSINMSTQTPLFDRETEKHLDRKSEPHVADMKHGLNQLRLSCSGRRRRAFHNACGCNVDVTLCGDAGCHRDQALSLVVPFDNPELGGQLISRPKPAMQVCKIVTRDLEWFMT